MHQLIENSVIILVFCGALVFLGRVIVNHFKGDKHASCSGGCSGCNTIDVEAIAKKIESDSPLTNS